jgi:hypothetical protein
VIALCSATKIALDSGLGRAAVDGRGRIGRIAHPGSGQLGQDSIKGGARLGGEVTADGRHPVDVLLADGDAASASPVVVGEVPVRVEAVGELVGQLAQLIGAVLDAQLGKLRFGLCSGLYVDEVGQPMDKPTDHCDVGGSELSVTLCGGGGRQDRVQLFAGNGRALAKIGGLADTSRRFGAGDAQPIGQRVR